MNAWRKFEEVVKPWMIVVAFVLLLLLGFCREAKADVTVELGPTFLSGEYSKSGAILIREDFDNHYSLALGFMGEQEVTDRSGNTYHPGVNLFVQGQRQVRLGQHWELGLGVAHFNATHRGLSSHFNAALSVGWEKGPWSFHFRHWSNAGSSRPNMGQDLFTLGYTFQ